ncbi:MAG TPA: hemerythrin domain-containing protein [Burkholderiales bacterium]|jgi:hemerythrin-like domain-containing protein|nr:hemerythrin domain-containing protein [Burkholderiales bacterium]
MSDFQARRRFLSRAAALSATALLPTAQAFTLQETKPAEKSGKAEEVSPTEDLMREHGVLNRVLLIYEELGNRLRNQREFDPKTLTDAAGIIRRFIEQYHEKLEEDYVFPRFEKAGKLTDLVQTLKSQHAAGRRVTADIQQLSTAASLKTPANRTRLEDALHAFIRMYRPHEAREDTVLFPALHDLISQHEFDALGEDFEKKEHELFGEEGFEKMVAEVTGLEKSLGLYDLSQFTP